MVLDLCKEITFATTIVNITSVVYWENVVEHTSRSQTDKNPLRFNLISPEFLRASNTGLDMGSYNELYN